MPDIVITLPADTKWPVYEREMAAVRDGREVMNFRLRGRPRALRPGDRCYLVYQGAVRGWMEVTGVGTRAAFTCTTTGREWPAGAYVQRSGPFHALAAPVPYAGFQGFRYAPDDWAALATVAA